MTRRIGQVLTLVVFFGLFLGLGVWGHELPDRNGSGLEARKLQQRPTTRLKAIVSGNLAKDWDTYLSDQFPERDLWVRGYMAFNLRGLGKVAMNEAVVGRGRQLLWDLSKKPTLTPEQLEKEVTLSTRQFKKLQDLVESYGGEFLYVGHPTTQSYMRAAYPVGFEFPATFDQQQDALFASMEENGIPHVDMGPIFDEHRDEKLFFRTDHHFNARAAYYVYDEIVRRTGQEPLAWGTDFRVTTLQPPFVGSMNRKLGLAMPFDETIDYVELARPIPYEKMLGGKVDNRITYLPEPGEPNSYKIYMDGDHPHVVIKTNRPELPSILFFGDSFTNAVEPMLWANYDETRIVDMRYYKASLYNYITIHKPDYVVTLVRDELCLWRRGNGRFDGLDKAKGATE